jgi:hypothetical protein
MPLLLFISKYTQIESWYFWGRHEGNESVGSGSGFAGLVIVKTLFHAVKMLGPGSARAADFFSLDTGASRADSFPSRHHEAERVEEGLDRMTGLTGWISTPRKVAQ